MGFLFFLFLGGSSFHNEVLKLNIWSLFFFFRTIQVSWRSTILMEINFWLCFQMVLHKFCILLAIIYGILCGYF